MFSLIRLLMDLGEKLGLPKLSHIIRVQRMPATKALRAHLWGLTLGLGVFLLTFFMGYSARFAGLPWFASPLILVIFIYGPFAGGPFVIISAIIFSYLKLADPSPGTFSFTFNLFTQWYLLAYAFGAVFATLYNDFLLLHMYGFGKKRIKISFAYDTTKEFNVIKAPNEREEAALLQELKPIMHYVKNIEDDKGKREDNASEIVKSILKAYCRMSAYEQNQLKKILLGKDLEKPVGENLKRDECKKDDPTYKEFEELLKTLKTGLQNKDEAALSAVEKAEPLLEKYLQFKEQKLYNYQLEALPPCPYTIAFVANPFIRKRLKLTKENGAKEEFVLDPIIRDRDLFLRYVDLALSSFDRNEVLGRPEIWSRVRIITIFDDKLAKANKKELNQKGQAWGLLEEFQQFAQQDGVELNNLLDCRREMLENFARMLQEYHAKITLQDIDVIFALSAHPTHERSMAHFTDWVYYDVPPQTPKSPRNWPFTYDLDPYKNKIDPTQENIGSAKIKKGAAAASKARDSQIKKPQLEGKIKHDHFTDLPGRVAVNVLSARQRTFVHEFGHAMSSAVHGAIVDEYFDEFFVENPNFKLMPPTSGEIPFYVNRIERVKKADGCFVPVHQVFAEYNNTVFHTDMAHPSTEEDWVGYFPERHDPNVGCTMDRTYGRYRFDKLISRFMYDRIVSKLNRSR
jgi:hypothetical protein